MNLCVMLWSEAEDVAVSLTAGKDLFCVLTNVAKVCLKLSLLLVMVFTEHSCSADFLFFFSVLSMLVYCRDCKSKIAKDDTHKVK